MKIRLNLGQESFYIVSLALLISLPFGFFWGSVFAVIWIIHTVVWFVVSSHKLNSKQQLSLWLLFITYLFLSCLWSDNISESLDAISNKALLFLLPFSGLFLPAISKNTIRKILHSFSIFLSGFAIILFVLALVKWHTYQYDSFLFYHEMVSPLKLNAIYVSYIFAVVWLINFMLISSFNWISVSYQFIIALFLILLSSKNILLITALIFAVQLSLKINSKSLKAGVLAVGLILFALFILTNNPIKNRYLNEYKTSSKDILQNSNFEDRIKFTGTEVRLLQMRAYYSQDKTFKDLVFGLGIGNSEPEIKQFHQNLNTPEGYQNYNYHNQYLQILSEAGILGLIFFISFLIILGMRFRHDKTFLPFFLISVSLFFTESVLWRQRGIIFFCLFLIFMLKYKPNEGQFKI